MRVAGTWRLVRARTGRRMRSWVHMWRSSLQVRVITTTTAIGLVTLTLVGAYVSERMRDSLFEGRVDQVLEESARSTQQAQATFDSSTATTGPEVLRLLNDVVTAQASGGTGEREVFLMRAPNQSSPVSVGAAASDKSLLPLVSAHLQIATGRGGQHWQSVAWPVGDDDVEPAVMVGQNVDVPLVGTFQLYFLYSLQSEQDRLDFLQRTLGLATVCRVTSHVMLPSRATRATVASPSVRCRKSSLSCSDCRLYRKNSW